MNIADYLNMLGPIVGKFATDLVKRFLPNMPVWQIQVLAMILGFAATFITTQITGHELSPAVLALYALATIAVNEAGNTLKSFHEDKGPNGGNGGVVGAILVGLMLAGSLQAQDTNAPTLVNGPDTPAIATPTLALSTDTVEATNLFSLVAWVQTNGHASGGEGFRLNGDKGPVINTAVDIIHYNKGRIDGGLGLANVIWFGPNETVDYFGISLNIAIVRTAPKVTAAVKAASLTVINVERIYGFVFAGLPLTDIVNVNVEADHALVAVGVGARF